MALRLKYAPGELIQTDHCPPPRFSFRRSKVGPTPNGQIPGDIDDVGMRSHTYTLVAIKQENKPVIASALVLKAHVVSRLEETTRSRELGSC